MKLLALLLLPFFLSAPLTHARITLDSTLLPSTPLTTPLLFEAKRAANLTFANLGTLLSRDEIAIAALFYGQAAATPSDIQTLSSALSLPAADLERQFLDYPNRGGVTPMPPTEPLIYRLYEIVMVYGYAYKAVINEMFGDGIMSAISFSTKVEREGERGSTSEYVVITMRGRWLPFSRF